MQNKDNSTLIGHVQSVNGSLIALQLLGGTNSLMPIIDGSVYRIGQIGSFVRIPLGYTHLYGIVTKAGADAIPPSTIANTPNPSNFNFSRWVSVVLVGERTAEKFERGITQFPAPEDEVHLVTNDDLRIIYRQTKESFPINVGHISASESLPALIDLDKLVTRHSAILGSTGSGKSNAVSVILEAIASHSDFQSARILLIDPHGEYQSPLKNHSKVFKIKASKTDNEEELQIPFWALPFSEFMNIFSGTVSENAGDKMREEIVLKKRQVAKLISRNLDELAIGADTPIPFSLRQLWYDWDYREREVYNKLGAGAATIEEYLAPTKKGSPDKLKSSEHLPPAMGGGNPNKGKKAIGISSFLDGMRTRIIDERYKFLFELGDYNPSLNGKTTNDLSHLLESWLNHSKAITILDLSGVPPELMTSIVGALVRIIYDSLYWGQNLNVGGRNQPLLIALEEAHNYLKSGQDSIASRTVQNIAKEGRKYGVGLMLITQRPSELDETILSQVGTFVALRMNNSKDRNKVSAAIQDDLSDLTTLLPSLRTGEGLILGEGVKIPTRIRFDKASNNSKSSDPKVSERWKEPKPDSKEYEVLLLNWRNRNIK